MVQAASHSTVHNNNGDGAYRLIEKEFGKPEKEMNDIIQNSPSLQKNYQLLPGIKEVGAVLAAATPVKTKNFTRFSNAEKVACFCGTAPFEYSPGSSVRGKTNVSRLADKRMKTLPDNSAESAVRYDRELRKYYLKRDEAGKSKMSTVNVVRNKILYRMFAVIRRQSPFVENFFTGGLKNFWGCLVILEYLITIA